MSTHMTWKFVVAAVVGFGAFCVSDNFWTTTKPTYGYRYSYYRPWGVRRWW
jgi:hypothetical protein